LAARGYMRLPQSLPEALDRFLANRTVAGWFPAGFVDTYAKHKKGEMAFLKGKAQEEICALYEQVY
jgi:glutamine synthetase